MTHCANIGIHVARKFRGNVEAETGAAWAHGDGSRLINPAALKLTPNISWQSWAVIAHANAHAAMVIFDGKLAASFFVRVMHSIEAKVVNHAIEQVTIGGNEARLVGIMNEEIAVVVAEKILQFPGDVVTNAAHGDWLHGE